MALPIRYNVRNLLVRRTSSALTFTVVGVVVFVLTVLLSFAAGIRASLMVTGQSSNILIIRPGATAESTSIIEPDEANRVVQAPGIARDSAGNLLVSPELAVQQSIPRVDGGNPANVAVRGIDDLGLAVHSEVKIIQGRPFRQGALEAIVGKQALPRFEGLRVGGRIGLGRYADRQYEIVGVFEAGGSAFESEIWTPRSMLSDSYHRRLLSSIVVRLEDRTFLPQALAYLNGPSVRLNARRETDYYTDLTSKTQEIVGLTTILVTIMGIGAAFAVANTMYAAVDARRREIAMLRTIGFSRPAIVAAFVLEGLILCLSACAAALLGAFALNGWQQDFLSDTTWTVLAYELRVTPAVLATALGTAVAVAVVGALAPALRAARIQIIEALRKA